MFDFQVLSFKAVRVPSGDEVVILYHLSDGTYEVKKDGKVFLKRPIGSSSAAVLATVDVETVPNPYAVDIGDEVKISGHMFRVIDADAFTRRHLETVRGGVRMGQPELPPSVGREDAIAMLEGMGAKESKKSKESKQSQESNRKRLTSYLSHGEDLKAALRHGTPAAWNGVVLQVWAVDSLTKLDRYIILFHLEDASVELRLVDSKNEMKSSLVLSRTCLVDPLAVMLGESAKPVARAFQPTDFLVGSHIKLCGRELLVIKMLGTSAAWMADHIDGIDRTALDREILPVEAGHKSRKTRPDTTSDDKRKAPEPLPHDLDMMQFLAIGGTTDGRGQDRFVIRVYCEDRSISILAYETGSKFLTRGHYQVDVQEELFIGAMVVINRHQFEIIDASRATLLYIASHPEIFKSSQADHALISRVKESLYRHTHLGPLAGGSINRAIDQSAGTGSGTGAATIEDLAAMEDFQGVPRAKLISAAVLISSGIL